MEIEEIKRKAAAKIKEAFADTPMPDKGNYWQGPHDCTDIEDRIGGIHWKEISSDVLFYQRDCLDTLTPEAFRFYVPAYMLFVLLDPDKADTLVDTIIGDLCPSSGKSYSNWINRELIEKSTIIHSKEAEGIVAFLKAYQNLIEADDPYFEDPYFNNAYIWGHMAMLKSGILFWTYIRDGKEVSL